MRQRYTGNSEAVEKAICTGKDKKISRIYGLVKERFRKVQSIQDYYLLTKREILERATDMESDNKEGIRRNSQAGD